MITIRPEGLTVFEWCDYTAGQILSVCTPPKLLDGDAWQDWGANLMQFEAIANARPPNPYEFANWREWADRFNQVIETIQ